MLAQTQHSVTAVLDDKTNPSPSPRGSKEGSSRIAVPAMANPFLYPVLTS
jgi:hypothetical protein